MIQRPASILTPEERAAIKQKMADRLAGRERRRLARDAKRTRTVAALICRYGDACVYCEEPLYPEEITIDHLVPRSKGGTHDLDNLVPACLDCNLLKADKHGIG